MSRFYFGPGAWRRPWLRLGILLAFAALLVGLTAAAASGPELWSLYQTELSRFLGPWAGFMQRLPMEMAEISDQHGIGSEHAACLRSLQHEGQLDIGAGAG